MLALEDGESLLFWDEFEIASLRPEFRNRWQAVHRLGMVAHRPTPPPPGPWVPLGQALVLPQHLRSTPEGLLDPAGFLYPQATLAPVPAPQPLPEIEGIPCPRQEIYGLQKHKQTGCVWKTDRGEFVWKKPRPPKACLLMPEMVMLKKGYYVNRLRISRIRHDYFSYFVELDNGEVYKVSKQSPEFGELLGLTNLIHLDPPCEALYGNYVLRDWPFELATAPAEVLRGMFESPRQLIGHLIFQRLRYLQEGLPREWTESYRGFWYDWIKNTLYRAGLLAEPEIHWPAPEVPDFAPKRNLSKAETMYNLMFRIFDFFVEDYRLFTFEEFGFVEPRPDCRRIGRVSPEIILVTEKEDFSEFGLRLCEEFGVSLRMLASQPPIIGSEFFAKALKPLVTRPVRVIAYVDYDVGGWILGRAFAKQLAMFGLDVSRVDFMIRGDSFTADEKRLHAKPLPMKTAAHRTKSRQWFEETGGVDGKPLGIHSDHVKPYERVRALFMAALKG